MERLPRYRTGDPELDAAVAELVNRAGVDEHPDLVFELIASALRMARDQANRGDLKIANAALKEMRYAFHVFAPYRGQRKVAIFGSARTMPDDPLYEQARSFAEAMAARDWMVITGAGPGIMSAGIEGAGTENSFGVNIRLPFEAATSQFIADDPKLINFRYFFTRKLAFMKESHGFVLLPGGFGTMDEAFELLTQVQTGKSLPAPVVLLEVPGGTYWASWRDFVCNELAERRLISPDDLSLVHITDDVEDAVAEIEGFYANYHSLRFVDRALVMRLRTLPSEAQLERLNTEFADIVTSGRIEVTKPSASEVGENDHVDLHRLRFRFDRTHWARLRKLIDALNAIAI
ncbi:MAG: TIGR00730 family Rossman fold protein [Acidimicrobiia bacterium]